MEENKGSEEMSVVRRASKIEKAVRLLRKLADKAYRVAYIEEHTKRFLAQQMRAFRGDRSQKEMGDLLGKPQSVVSRMEDPTYGRWTLTNLFEVAASLDKAVLVRFVSPDTFVEFAGNVSDDAQNPESFTDKSIEEALARLSFQASIRIDRAVTLEIPVLSGAYALQNRITQADSEDLVRDNILSSFNYKNIEEVIRVH